MRRPSGIFPTQQVNILCRWASFSSSATRGPTKRPSTSSRIPTCQGLWSLDSTDSCTFHCPKRWVIYDDGTPYDTTQHTQHSISLPFFHNLFVGWLFRFSFLCVCKRDANLCAFCFIFDAKKAENECRMSIHDDKLEENLIFQIRLSSLDEQRVNNSVTLEMLTHEKVIWCLNEFLNNIDVHNYSF